MKVQTQCHCDQCSCIGSHTVRTPCMVYILGSLAGSRVFPRSPRRPHLWPWVSESPPIARIKVFPILLAGSSYRRTSASKMSIPVDRSGREPAIGRGRSAHNQHENLLSYWAEPHLKDEQSLASSPGRDPFAPFVGEKENINPEKEETSCWTVSSTSCPYSVSQYKGVSGSLDRLLPAMQKVLMSWGICPPPPMCIHNCTHLFIY